MFFVILVALIKCLQKEATKEEAKVGSCKSAKPMALKSFLHPQVEAVAANAAAEEEEEEVVYIEEEEEEESLSPDVVVEVEELEAPSDEKAEAPSGEKAEAPSGEKAEEPRGEKAED